MELRDRWRGYDGHFDRVRELRIRDFGDFGVADDELIDGARQLDRSVAERVLGALHASHRAAAGLPLGTVAAVAPQILLSLRHPLLWVLFH